MQHRTRGRWAGPGSELPRSLLRLRAKRSWGAAHQGHLLALTPRPGPQPFMYGDYIAYDCWLGKVYDLKNQIILKLSNGARYTARPGYRVTPCRGCLRAGGGGGGWQGCLLLGPVVTRSAGAGRPPLGWYPVALA